MVKIISYGARFVTRCYTVYAHHDLGFGSLGCVRGKIDCLESRDSGEGFGGVGRIRGGPRWERGCCEDGGRWS